MALEATVICIDNSEWMRNGDFSPSRFEAQQDACLSICGAKTRQNPENSVGLIATAGRAVEVCVPLTQDLGKLIAALHKVKISGEANFVGSLRVAQLALRHRQKTGKKQEQRIVLFVGSPVTAEKQELEDLGRQLKKNSISIDIISFGEPNAQQNEEKLQTLLAATNNADENGKDTSHFVPIPTGNMSDILGQMTGDQAGGASAAMELDPELAWAMELSKQTFEQETKQTTGTSETKSDSTDVEMRDTEEVTATPSATSPQVSFGGLAGLGDYDNDPEFLEAIRLSLQAGAVPGGAPASAPAPVVAEEDPELLEAIRLSQATASEDQQRDEHKKDEPKEEPKKDQPAEKKEEPKKDDMELDMSSIGSDVMEAVLMGLPIDKDDPEVLKLLQAIKKDDKDKDKK